MRPSHSNYMPRSHNGVAAPCRDWASMPPRQPPTNGLLATTRSMHTMPGCAISMNRESRKSSRSCAEYWPEGFVSAGVGASPAALPALALVRLILFGFCARRGCVSPATKHTTTVIVIWHFISRPPVPKCSLQVRWFSTFNLRPGLSPHQVVPRYDSN